MGPDLENFSNHGGLNPVHGGLNPVHGGLNPVQLPHPDNGPGTLHPEGFAGPP